MLSINRRDLLRLSAATAATSLVGGRATANHRRLDFQVSLVESSVSRLLKARQLDHLEFVRFAKQEFDIGAVEYVSSFFPNQAPPSEDYIGEMNQQAAEHNTRQLLIAIDERVRIGGTDAQQRAEAIELVNRWIDAAKLLGCHSVEIDPTSAGPPDDQKARVVASLNDLCRYAESRRVNVLLGNHGGASADADWVASVIQATNSPVCRALPRIGRSLKQGDYQRLAKLAPLAKGVTADTQAFDDLGNETTTDFARAIQSIYDAGYGGYVGINYFGEDLDEHAGIAATKALLERVKRVETIK